MENHKKCVFEKWSYWDTQLNMLLSENRQNIKTWKVHFIKQCERPKNNEYNVRNGNRTLLELAQ